MKAITTGSEYPAWVQRDLSNFSDARRSEVLRFARILKLKGASPLTINGYVKAIRSLGFDGKEYKELSSEDLITWMEGLGSNGFSIHTINTTRKMVKTFLRFTHGCESSADPTPEPLKCIREQRLRQHLPKVILSRAEIKALVDVCKNQRDRALVFVGYESGARAGELMGLKIGDAEFDKFGVLLRLKGKTGERVIRLVEAVPDLRTWISMHPDGKNPEARLWPGKHGPLGTLGLWFLLERLGEEVKIGKHIHPHLLRHSRATHLATVLTEAQMREFFGWSKSSRMPEVYTHLSARDTDATLLKHYGIKVEARPDDQLEPKVCPWCDAFNSTSARFCSQCNAPLDPIGANKAAEKERKRNDFARRYLEWQLQNPSISPEIFLRENRKELEELAQP